MPTIRNLSLEEVEHLYHTEMVEAFPASELKAYKILQRMIKEGWYDVLAYEEGETLYAYACLAKNEKADLLDYFASSAPYRGQGWGSLFLKELLQGRNKPLLIELESLDYAENIEDRALRERRIRFYERLGCVDSGYQVRLFGVEYHLYSFCWSPKKFDMIKTYQAIYAKMIESDLVLEAIKP